MYVYKPAAVYKTIFYNQWHTLDCEGADTVHFRAHWGGLLEKAEHVTILFLQ